MLNPLWKLLPGSGNESTQRKPTKVLRLQQQYRPSFSAHSSPNFEHMNTSLTMSRVKSLLVESSASLRFHRERVISLSETVERLRAERDARPLPEQLQSVKRHLQEEILAHEKVLLQFRRLQNNYEQEREATSELASSVKQLERNRCELVSELHRSETRRAVAEDQRQKEFDRAELAEQKNAALREELEHVEKSSERVVVASEATETKSCEECDRRKDDEHILHQQVVEAISTSKAMELEAQALHKTFLQRLQAKDREIEHLHLRLEKKQNKEDSENLPLGAKTSALSRPKRSALAEKCPQSLHSQTISSV